LKYLIANYKAGPFGSALITSRLYEEGKFLIYTPEHIAKNSTDLSNNLFLPDERLEEMQNFLVSAGDIIFPIVGTLGRAMQVNENMPCGIINQRLAKFRISSQKLNEKYFLRLFATSTFYDDYIKLQSRGSIILNLTKQILYDMPVPLPPLAEQKKISDYLDKKCSAIDSAVDAAKKLVAKLRDYKKSLITETVTKGLNPSAEMQDSNIEWLGEIPSHWKVVPMKKYLSSIIDYRGKTPTKVDEGIFLVTARNIKDGRINYELSQEFVRKSEYNEIMHRGKPKVGDVLFTTEAPLGEVANVDKIDIALAQRIIKFTPAENLDSYFLKYCIMSHGFQEFLKTLSTGSTASGIKSSKIFMLKIPLPPLEEQKQIAEFLDRKCAAIDENIFKHKQLADKLTEYKKSLIYEVVTGKMEV